MTAHSSPAAARLRSGQADRIVAALRGVFRDRLRSVVGYGPHIEDGSDGALSCLALVTSLTLADLEACAARAYRWQRDGIATPLVLPEDEFSQLVALPQDKFQARKDELLNKYQLPNY